MEPTTLLCPRCGTVATTDAAFCTVCGAAIHPSLSNGESEADHVQPPAPHLPAPLASWLRSADTSYAEIPHGSEPRPPAHPRPVVVPSDASAVEPATRRFTARKMLATAFVLVAVVAVTLLAVAWRSEANAHHAAAAKAASLSTQLAWTRTSLAHARTSLAQVRNIAQKRRAVLLQAEATVGKVDPLLTRVDGVKSAAAKASQAYGTWGDTLVNAYNYLNNSSYLTLNVSYLNSLIDQANSQLATAQAADAAYEQAVKAFGNNADSFTQSVRALQRQLKSVTGG